MILKFGEKGGVVAMSPIRLTAVIKELIGEVVNAKVLKDGTLLGLYKEVAQREKSECSK